MKHVRASLGTSLSVYLICLTLTGCLDRQETSTAERHITILATNDIHGGVDAHPGPKQNDSLGALNLTGGLAIFSGVVKAIKQGIQTKYGADGGVLVVDAGDQFQGTLISNYTEGALVFSAMNQVGYDAAITGNHDYDFGPHGWLVDSVKDQDPANPDKDPRGVIKDLASKASFPIISANTYYKNSLVDTSGNPVDVSGAGCVPTKNSAAQIDWSKAKSPEFLKPYSIKNIAGVRVALIGLDNPQTPTTTTPDNVTDLCFRDEFEAFKDVRASLQGKADVFVLIVHDGNIDNELNGTALATKIHAYSPTAADAIVAGHTHVIHNVNVSGIPVIQSGHGGDRFGRIDLVYDPKTRSVNHDKTVSVAGARLDYAACDPVAKDFCAVLPDQTGVTYEGVAVAPDAKIASLIADAKKQVAPLADRVLGEAASDLTVDRIGESSLADALTDAFREISKADVAFMNTGGLRTSIKKGPVTYSNLFEVVPFNNHGYVVGPMPATKLLALLQRSIETCGNYGALMQSGLKVAYSRNCAKQPVDHQAQLLHVETLSGEVIADAAQGIQPRASRVFNVATLDFLAEGGSGYTDFIGTPLINDLGVIRDVLADALAKSPAQWSGKMDGRWQQVSPAAAPEPAASP